MNFDDERAKGWLVPDRRVDITQPPAAGNKPERDSHREVGRDHCPWLSRAPTVWYNGRRRAGWIPERGVMELARAAAMSGTTIAVTR